MAWMPPGVFPPRPPVPMPRTKRPGGYWTPQDIMGGLKGGTGAFLGDALSDLGYGWSQGGFDKGFEYAGQRTAQMTPVRAEQDTLRKEQQLAIERAKANAVFIKDPALAKAVADGQMDFQTAYSMWKDQTKPAAQLDQADTAAGRQALGQQMGLTGNDLVTYTLTGQLPSGRGAAGEISLQPTWGIDQDPQSPTYGQTVIGQLGKDGTFHRTDMGGVQPINPYELAAQRTGGQIDGKTAAAARAALPGTQQAVDIAVKTVDALLGDTKGQEELFSSTFFIPNQKIPFSWPGTPKADFWNNVMQAQGGAFLQARQWLKGQGAITEIESLKAEQAMSQMQIAAENGSKEAFLQAAQDFRAAVLAGVEKLRETAEGGYAAGNVPGLAPPAAPTGTTSTGVPWSVDP